MGKYGGGFQIGRKHFNYSHGQTGTPEFHAWAAMMARCYNPKNKMFKHYEGRGITVCDRWGYRGYFLEDMGKKPTPKHTLERIDNNGNYCKKNCRWATQTQQQRNKRTNKLTMAEAVKIRWLYNHTACTQYDLADEFGVSRSHIGFIINNKRWKEKL